MKKQLYFYYEIIHKKTHGNNLDNYNQHEYLYNECKERYIRISCNFHTLLAMLKKSCQHFKSRNIQ